MEKITWFLCFLGFTFFWMVEKTEKNIIPTLSRWMKNARKRRINSNPSIWLFSRKTARRLNKVLPQNFEKARRMVRLVLVERTGELFDELYYIREDIRVGRRRRIEIFGGNPSFESRMLDAEIETLEYRKKKILSTLRDMVINLAAGEIRLRKLVREKNTDAVIAAYIAREAGVGEEVITTTEDRAREAAEREVETLLARTSQVGCINE
ncbi:MAG: hypothetical protein UW63_C0051G0007 [Candidatus Uhrbacteria bacterium GW2011_GWF2_44_350]|uniref:Uncharacterized protein n=1 Tax=Candidatus Uhrbacteria bacterium GW2011_GWF2_44_350 TaxID=1619000 RepID=A0A0G1MCH4_9BACT|nr:MAG: hypothetical protein UW63_C0051G0007 [Candidatus Uhrbacteria bacterium GW2011_GWF2_44_350]